MAKSKKPWSDCWKTISQIGGGGQGNTYLVNSVLDDTQACLKTLSNNKDKERRERFRRECVVLETLDHPSIPKFIASNSSEFRGEEPLYLVTEFIGGTTLAKKIDSDKLLDKDTAIDLAERILSILEFVHSKDVVHRDIKPDNIMLREQSYFDPVLVDFGLSFNEDYAMLSTETLQQIGNRFLHLPELQSDSSNKRNPISDITQVCGILLYTLTGLPPTVLLDEHGRMPHQRDKIRESLAAVDGENELLPVFDRAFRQATSERWHSARQLRSRLESIRIPDANRTPQDIQCLASQLQATPDFLQRSKAGEVFEDFNKFVNNTITEFFNGIAGQPFTFSQNEHPDYKFLTYTANRYLQVKNFDEIKVHYSLHSAGR
jgi:eukaryotic-like serine/threonine-protein kinase